MNSLTGERTHFPSRLERPPARVVSLVPSETETVAALGCFERLVGRTEYCVEPAGAIESVPIIGGTKNVDIDAVCDLQPDLVLANQEENTRQDVEALIDRGLLVHVSFPQTLSESARYVDRLATLLGVRHEVAVDELIERHNQALAAPLESHPLRAFVPIWSEPLMTFNEHTFAHDVLVHCGFQNVFATRERRYPLAADIGDAAQRVIPNRDTRYPRVTLGELAALKPQVILLPDEPYRFTDVDAAAMRAHRGLVDATTLFVDGKALFWYGASLRWMELRALRTAVETSVR